MSQLMHVVLFVHADFTQMFKCMSPKGPRISTTGALSLIYIYNYVYIEGRAGEGRRGEGLAGEGRAEDGWHRKGFAAEGRLREGLAGKGFAGGGRRAGEGRRGEGLAEEGRAEDGRQRKGFAAESRLREGPAGKEFAGGRGLRGQVWVLRSGCGDGRSRSGIFGWLQFVAILAQVGSSWIELDRP